MFNLATFSINKNNSLKMLISSMAVFVLLLSGCAAEFPGGSEGQEGELTLASKIERESNFVRVNNIAQGVVWDADRRRIVINGFDGRGTLSISNAATGQFIGATEFDDDDDDRRRGGLVLQNITAVPCSVRVQIGNQVQNVPVLNAPLNCIGIASTSQTLHVDRARWKLSSNKLTVEGGGASPRQLVSVFDGITGQLLGTDQSSSVGNWKVKVRNMLNAPCSVSIVSGGQTIRSTVTNAPLICGSLSGIIPGLSNGFNQAPEGVIVGPIADMTINVGGSVNFMGTGFDPDSTLPLTYYWRFDGAAPDSILQNQPVTFSQPGVYVVSLTVMDSTGMVDASPSTRTIVVQPTIGATQAPSGQIISPITNVEVNAGGYVNFMGTGFDPDGLSVRYVWNFAGGTPLDLNAANTANPGNVLFSTPGVYLVSLTVIDGTNVSDPTPEYRAITVRGGNTGNPNNSPTNQAPDGMITSPSTDISIPVGTAQTFSAIAFDPDSTSGMSYRWNFGGAAPASTQQNPTVVFNQAGIYMVTLVATDALGRSDLTPSTRIITVGSGVGNNPNNTAPESTITFPSTSQTISAGQSINFMGSGYDLDGNNPLSYRWDFMGAASNSTLQNPGAVFFTQPGVYNVTLTVTDSLGQSDFTPAIRTITVLSGNGAGGSGQTGFVNRAPESTISLPVSNTIISVGQYVEFAGMGTDPENDSPLIYTWDFDNVAPDAMVQNPGKVTFTRAGSYRVRLAVTDANGNTDLTPAERIITVRNGLNTNLEPIGTISSPASSMNINAGGSVNFAAYATDLQGNSAFSYEWDFGGAAPASFLQNPGSIVFNETGIFKVTLYVKDSFGNLDSTPEVRFITVQGTSGSNQAPTSRITSPLTDVTVNVNDSIMFAGVGEDTDNFGSNLTYNWNFGGAAANSSLASPGVVTFSQAGVYTVSLNVMDNFGLFDATPATRTITVVGNSFNNSAPTVNITNPTFQAVVNVNGSVSFSAFATDPNNDPVTYYWNFDGAAADSTLQSPGNIVFTEPGTYKVSVVAIDSRNLRSIPAITTITVGSPTGATSAPDGMILTPVNDMNIAVGTTLNFMGSATSAFNTNGLRYRWNFDGAAVSSTAQNPGNVTFNRVGTYRVALTVADNTGATDMTPAIRTITVSANGAFGQQPGTGNTGQGPNGIISSPMQAVTNVAVGGSVNFSATGTSSSGSAAQLSYRWSFGNGLPDQYVQTPGLVYFPAQGTYNVTLTVSDIFGGFDQTPDVRTVIVGGGGNNNGGASTGINGVINSPSSSVTISRGQSVYFAGAAESSIGAATNATYSWDFAGGAVNSTLQTPGNVLFNTAGMYVVKLTVRDNQGNTDLTPATQVVIVLP
ncbi:MAG: PKD domain-containing protein [Gammaproteobacteria bacterium]|nr:PKD domain-containing protein [Gammaproteobacteria bacterium]